METFFKILIVRSFVRSFVRSLVRSIARSERFRRSLARSLVLSHDCCLAQSVRVAEGFSVFLLTQVLLCKRWSCATAPWRSCARQRTIPRLWCGPASTTVKHPSSSWTMEQSFGCVRLDSGREEIMSSLRQSRTQKLQEAGSLSAI